MKLSHIDTICHICNNPDYEEKNQIVYCGLCNITVH